MRLKIEPNNKLIFKPNLTYDKLSKSTITKEEI